MWQLRCWLRYATTQGRRRAEGNDDSTPERYALTRYGKIEGEATAWVTTQDTQRKEQTLPILGLIIGTALFLRRRSRPSDTTSASGIPMVPGPYSDKPDTPPDYKELPAFQPPAEVGDGVRHEMDAYGVR